MNKAEAIAAMVCDNAKVRHKYFTQDEWMKDNNGRIEFENGVICDYSRFFHTRKGDCWETGWSIYEDEREGLPL